MSQAVAVAEPVKGGKGGNLVGGALTDEALDLSRRVLGTTQHGDIRGLQQFYTPPEAAEFIKQALDPLGRLTLRDAVGHIEAYEPARGLTHQALACSPSRVSTSRLAAELQRLQSAPIVLNRALRDAVQRAVAGGELSMRDRRPLRAHQARHARERQRRDELARAPHRHAPRVRRRASPPLDTHRRARAHRPRRALRQPARRRTLSATAARAVPRPIAERATRRCPSR